MGVSQPNESDQAPEGRLNHVPNDAELKVAELERIRAEQAKLNAEAKEIKRRLTQPWWYIRPSALTQTVIAGIVGGGVFWAFMLDNVVNINTVNEEVQENLKYEYEKLQVAFENLQEERDSLRTERDFLLKKADKLKEGYDDLSDEYKNEGRSDEAKKAKLSAQNIQSRRNELVDREALNLIEALESPERIVRRSARARLAELYLQDPDIVGSAMARAIKENYGNYRITLGVLTALGKVEGGWETSDNNLKKQVESLSKSPNAGNQAFNEQFSEATSNMK